MKWRCLDRILDLKFRGEIMGVVNVTPDSFSDGGQFATVEKALEQARQLISEGAVLIDIGGESTRPGADRVDPDEECRRVLPVIEALAKEFPDVILSVDTSKAEVARAAVQAGARVINDVCGFRDAEMVSVAAETGAGLVVMHMQGDPQTMQSLAHYEDLHLEITTFFKQRVAALLEAGVDLEAIVLDPGIGFGKTLEHNLSILRELPRFSIEERPILLGVSRKSFLKAFSAGPAIEDRRWSTVAITAHAREQGIRLHRVHEVKPNLEAMRMTEAIIGSCPAV